MRLSPVSLCTHHSPTMPRWGPGSHVQAKHHEIPCSLPFPQVDLANIDILLVGDSASMVVHGHDTTLPVTLDQMLTHCQSVARGAQRAFLVSSMRGTGFVLLLVACTY